MKKTILLVEDEAIIALLEKRWLINEGFRVIHVITGEAAVELVRSKNEQIDLILMDIDLGQGIDGTQAAQEILKTNDIPLLFLSSHTEPEIVSKTEQITSYGYVVKGSNNTVLLASINMAFKLHKAHCELKIKKESLKDREFWLNESQKVAKTGHYQYDIRSGRWSNSRMLDEILGTDDNYNKDFEGWLNIVHPDDREMMRVYHNYVIRERTLINKEYRVVRPLDGNVLWIHENARILLDESGEPASMFGTLQDITERKQAEEKIRFQANLLDVIGEAVVALDIKGTIIYWNQSAERLYKWTSDEVLGRNAVGILVSQYSEQQSGEIFTKLRNGENWSGEFLVQRRDGSLFPAMVTNSPIYNDKNELIGFIGISSDITARREAEKELLKSEEVNRAILGCVPDLFFRTTRNGVFIDYRTPNESMLFTKPELFLGKNVKDVLPSSVAEPLLEAIEKAYHSGEIVTFEYELPVNGEQKFYEDRIVPISNNEVISIVRDITERKRAENLFLIQRDLFAFMNSSGNLSEALEQVLKVVCTIESIDCGGLYLTDPDTHDLELMSHLGISEHFVRQVSHYRGDSPQLNMLHEGKPLYGQLNDIHGLGEPHDVAREGLKSVAVVPILHSGKPVGSLVLASRQHECIPLNARLALETIAAQIGGTIFRLRAEEDIMRVNRKLKETNTAKDKFFSVLAHDLRSPFLGFMGLTGDLEKNINTLPKEDIAEYASIMHSTSKKMFSLLNNLLEWSRLQTGNITFIPVDLDLSAEVENIRDLFSSAAANKSVTLINEINNGTTIQADQNMISTILRNLVSNAIKFSNDGGRVFIRSKHSGNSIDISVVDSGVGMDENILKNLFLIESGLSTRGTNGEEGSGLGLVICKEMIQKNGGQIKVRSTPGQGTDFTFTLPLMKALGDFGKLAI
ncbi:MAG: PAS domain S-box protein [Ignavibacteriales bacterium]